jgi:DNA-binding transcriptional ArsR family regulator
MQNEVFKALADPTRREILRLLRKRDLNAGEIAAHFDMSKPSISHHLGLLKLARLVVDLRRGQNIVYSLNMTVFQEALGWMLAVAGKENRKS